MHIQAVPGRRQLLPIHALWLYSTLSVAFMAASSVPTPLYRLYQEQWHFSNTLLTLAFGVYCISLLLTLLVTGRLSDYLGRKPVAAVAIVLEIVSILLFLNAGSVGDLIVARAVQGVATALATACAGAALLDLSRERAALLNSIAPMLGMGAGALLSCALVSWMPAPLHSVYAVMLVVFAISLVVLAFVPETSPRRTGAWSSLRPSLWLPPQTRAAFLAATPLNVSIWMVGGFYMSLMPSLIAVATHSSSIWLGGLVVANLTFSGGLAILLARALPNGFTFKLAIYTLLVGVMLVLLGANIGLIPLLLLGSLVAGVGFGTGFLAVLRSFLPLAQPQERAGAMGVFYAQCYTANSLPTLLAGFLAEQTNQLIAVNVYGCVIVMFLVASLVLARRLP